MTSLSLVSLIDRNLCFRFTGGELLVYTCRLSGAQKCSYPGTMVPLPWHNSALPKALNHLYETRKSVWYSVL